MLLRDMLFIYAILALFFPVGGGEKLNIQSSKCLPYFTVGETCEFTCSSTYPDVTFSEGNFTLNGRPFPQNNSRFKLGRHQFAFSLRITVMTLELNGADLQCRVGNFFSIAYTLRIQTGEEAPSEASSEAQETQQTLNEPDAKVTMTTSYSRRSTKETKSLTISTQVGKQKTSATIIGGTAGAAVILLLFGVLIISTICWAVYYRPNKTMSVEVTQVQESQSPAINEMAVFIKPEYFDPGQLMSNIEDHCVTPSKVEYSQTNTQGVAEILTKVGAQETFTPTSQPRSDMSRNSLTNCCKCGESTTNGTLSECNHDSASIESSIKKPEQFNPLPDIPVETQTITQSTPTESNVTVFGSISSCSLNTSDFVL